MMELEPGWLKRQMDNRDTVSEIIADLADALEAELNARYAGTLDCPSMAAKYAADMEPVLRARRLMERASISS